MLGGRTSQKRRSHMLFLVDWVRFWVKGMVLYQRGPKYEEGVSFRRGRVRFRVRFLVVLGFWSV